MPVPFACRTGLCLFALAAGVVAHPALAAPFDDARDNILAGNPGNAMTILAIGAMGVNDQDDAGYTLLDFAAKSGSLDAVRQLLNHGADPAIVAKDGKTAATLAATPEIRSALTAAIAGRQSP